MHIREYQDWLEAWDKARNWDKVTLSHILIHAMEELGEISRLVQVLEGYRPMHDNTSPEEVRDELSLELSDLQDMLFKIAYQEAISHLGQTYYIPIFTNSTVNDFRFTPTAKLISFNVTGLNGMGFCNITIPRTLLYADPEWTVRIDGNLLAPEEFLTTENAEYTFIYLNYSHSTHLVEIEGTWIISEFPPYVAPLIILAVSLIAAIIVVKKLSTLKNHQHMIKIFTRMISRLHPQKV